MLYSLMPPIVGVIQIFHQLIDKNWSNYDKLDLWAGQLDRLRSIDLVLKKLAVSFHNILSFMTFS
jgi:hypothetical protein